MSVFLSPAVKCEKFDQGSGGMIVSFQLTKNQSQEDKKHQ
jgi:hypothetical protein